MKHNLSKDTLIQVANELNELFGLKPPIVTSGKSATKPKLEAGIRKAGAMAQPEDEFSAETLNVLTVLGVDLTKEPEPQKESPKPKPKPQPKPKYTRTTAVVDALKSTKKPLSRDTWIQNADTLYCDHGGQANAKETKWCLNYALQVLTALDAVSETEEGYQLK